MLKKTVLFLILAAIVTGGVFAEDDFWNTSFKIDSGPTPFKGALFVDLGYSLYYLWKSPPGFGVGVGWEGRINDSSTYLISGNIGIYGDSWGGPWTTYGKASYTAFDFGIEGNYRYYFFKSAIDKLFINGGLGFGMITQNYTYERNREDKTYTWNVLYIPIYAGYKIIMGPGFVVEAQTGYRVGIGLNEFDDLFIPPVGGFFFGVAVGWAFK
ncbi:MAG: hypothetical protein LBC52_02015 [Treponema sp.]|nr:hypothetical protein [Treponema sp.]